jgi:hypothetical protein
MKPQQFGLTHYERREQDQTRRARNCFMALLCILCLAGMIEKFL